MTRSNEPAFPSEGEGHGNPKYHSPGMTLREYYAGQALSAVAKVAMDKHIRPDKTPSGEETRADWMARQSLLLADALLAALEGET